MTFNLPLFEHAERAPYPKTPGYKARDTSQAAAESMASRAESLRAQCLIVLRDGPKTADEVASLLGESVLSVRPRMSELATTRKIVDTKERRRNASSGKFAVVWQIA